MYQTQLIRSLILNRDTTVLSQIKSKSKQLFPDKNMLALFNVIHTYYLKLHKLPSPAYLEEFFKAEKDNIASEAFTQVKEYKDELDTDTRSYVELQSIYIAKSKALKIFKDKLNEVKIANGSDIQNILDKTVRDLVTTSSLIGTEELKEYMVYHNVDNPENEIKNALVSDYNLRKRGGNRYYKFNTGFDQIDRVIGGIHSVDFIGILGYVKNGKSYLARKIAYNVLAQGFNVLFISLEMSHDSILHSFLSLHANNIDRWGTESVKIKTADIRSATLSQKAEDFYLNKVIDDFTENPDFGSLYIKQPTGQYTPQSLFADVKNVEASHMTVDLLVVDYPSLMTPTSGYRDRESYNELFRELRHFSLVNGLPIIFPVQCNRAGFEAACKDKGNLFRPDAISDFSSIERECTHVMSIITTSEMREVQQSQIQHLLSRESELFAPMRIGSDFETGMMVELTGINDDDAEQIMQEIDI